MALIMGVFELPQGPTDWSLAISLALLTFLGQTLITLALKYEQSGIVSLGNSEYSSKEIAKNRKHIIAVSISLNLFKDLTWLTLFNDANNDFDLQFDAWMSYLLLYINLFSLECIRICTGKVLPRELFRLIHPNLVNASNNFLISQRCWSCSGSSERDCHRIPEMGL